MDNKTLKKAVAKKLNTSVSAALHRHLDTLIFNFLSGTIRHGIGARPILPILGTYGLFILILNLFVPCNRFHNLV